MCKNFSVDFLLTELSLYNEQTIDDIHTVYKLKSSSIETQFDSYCIYCKKESTFKKFPVSFGSPSSRTPKSEHIQGEFLLSFKCTREYSHNYYFCFRVQDDKIVKFGQYPSLADIESNKIEKYRSLLKQDYREFSKAIGLFSHGIGSGSYVYLRRIFENLINDQKNKALVSNPQLSEAEFAQKRMDEKIFYIKDYLPEILVKNRKIYSILSMGIHSLSEKQCLEMFPKVQIGIEIILDWKLAEKEQQEKEKALEKFISEATDSLK